jgi:hypothetical protein
VRGHHDQVDATAVREIGDAKARVAPISHPLDRQAGEFGDERLIQLRLE